jgi:hypothetical protein
MNMRKIYDLEFAVIWDQSRKAFGIERAGAPIGRFTTDKASAVALATQAALFENREGKRLPFTVSTASKSALLSGLRET